MLLSDRDIYWAVESGEISIDPFEPGQIQPASYDLRLADEFVLRNRADIRYRADGGEAFVIHPREFVLASTVETVRLATTIAARIEGKSTLGRLGLLAHVSAGFVDPGFEGTLTLELFNLSAEPVELRPGMLVGQLSFMRLSSAASAPYGSPGLGSHYQGQRGPTLPAVPRQRTEGIG